MLWYARYKLPDGRWQNWAVFEDKKEAEEIMKFHAQGRDFEILSEEEYEKKEKNT
ncbi:MAG: hypothetical protein AB1397_07805 [bacterium]